MTKKLFGLGKGLGSLIPDSVADAVNNRRESIYFVEVAKIQPNPDQPRTDFDQNYNHQHHFEYKYDHKYND
jgi:hypothetical protein